MTKLWQLFYTFFKIGAFTIGGGQAMLPLIQREVTDRRGWAGEDEMVDIITIAQSLPGVIAINTATAVGGKVAGKRGAVMATLGVVLPSVIIMAVVAAFFDKARELEPLNRAFSGARPAIAGLMAAAVWRLGKAAIKSAPAAVAACACFAAVVAGMYAPLTLLVCGGLGLAWYAAKGLFKQ